MKLNKVIKIIAWSLVGVVFVGGGILGFVNPTLLKKIIDYVKELLNQPLPIISVTVGAFLLFLWRVLVSTNYGKKIINALKQELLNIKNEHEEYKKTSEKEKAELRKENAILREQIANGFALSTNKKIRDYGKGLMEYGKETNDLDTKEE